MKMNSEILKKYFLGLLDSTDLEQVELQILEDDSLEENLIQAENELIEEYLDANLSNEEIIAFNQNYLITKERRKQVEFIRLLKAYAENHPLIEENPGFFEKLKSFFTRPQFAAGFAAILVLILLGIGFLIYKNPQNKFEGEIVNLNKKDLSNLAEYKNLKTINLVPETLRSADTIKFLPQTELTDQVLLRLALPAPINSEQTFSVSILQNGKIIQTISQRTYQNHEIRLLLPKSILTPGEYIIAINQNSQKSQYYFAIQ